MSATFVKGLAVFGVLLLASCVASASTPLSIGVAGNIVIGADPSTGSIWDLQNTASVSIQPGGANITLNGEIICKNGDISAGKCTSGTYLMIYQLVSAPPNAKI